MSTPLIFQQENAPTQGGGNKPLIFGGTPKPVIFNPQPAQQIQLEDNRSWLQKGVGAVTNMFKPTLVKPVQTVQPPLTTPGIAQNNLGPIQLDKSGNIVEPTVVPGAPANIGTETISAGKTPTSWDKVKEILSKPFKASDAELVARAGATVAVRDLFAKKNNIDPNQINLGVVQDNLDTYTKELGIRSTLNNKEFTELMFTLTMPATLAAGVPVIVLAKGIGKFALYSTAVDGVIATVTGKPMGEGLKSFLPENTATDVKDLVDILDLIGKAYLTHGMGKVEPRVADFLTKQKIIEYKLPRNISIDPATIKDIHQTGKMATPEQLSYLNDFQRDMSNRGVKFDWREAQKNGVEINIPSEKIVTITDKPYWAKIKAIIGLPKTEPISVTSYPEGKPAGSMTNNVKDTVTAQPETRQALSTEGSKVTEKPQTPTEIPVRPRENIKLANPPEGAVGSGVTIRPDGTANFNVEVAEGMRGKGVGTEIVKQQEALALSKGVNKVVLDVKEESVGFFAKLGYVAEGKVVRGLQVMTKTLTKPEESPVTPKSEKVSTPLEPLANEARKYKSAEEFVKAQGEPLFHATRDTKMSAFDPNYDYEAHNSRTDVGQVRDYETPYGRVFLTNDLREAKAYGQNVLDTYLPKNAKIKVIKTGDVPPSQYFDNEYNWGKLSDVIEKYSADAIKFVDNKGKATYLTFPEKLQTKSQLTDIWNKANQSKAVGEVKPLAQEAQKYKSAEEFVNASNNFQTGKQGGALVYLDKTVRSLKLLTDDPIAFLKSKGVIGTNGIVNDKEFLSRSSIKGILSDQKKSLTRDIEFFTKEAGLEKPTTLTDFYNQAKGGVSPQKTGDNLKAAPKIKEVDKNVTLKPIGTGEKKFSTLGVGVEQKAVEKKLIESLSDLPEYKQVNMKDQAEKALKLIETAPELATNVALGKENSPRGLLPEAVFTAVEEKAVREGSIDLITQLAKSTLVSQATAMGQRIRALAERNTDSPVNAIRQVIEDRKKALEEKFKQPIAKTREKIVRQIKSKIKTPNKADWNAFIDSIEC